MRRSGEIRGFVNILKYAPRGHGEAKLIFTDPEGNQLSSTQQYLSIPSMSNVEIDQFYEDQYAKAATTVGKTLENEYLEITIVKYGYYEDPRWMDTEGVKLFRIDMTIKNAGTDDKYPPYSFTIIDKNGNQYNKGFLSKMPFNEILSGATVNGYVVYHDLGTAIPDHLVIKKLDYPQDQVWNYDFS